MDFVDIFLSLSALIILEIILGIDNLVFLSILTEKLPTKNRKKARQLGLTLAWVMRVILLIAAVWLVQLKKPLLGMDGFRLSIRDLFLFCGGAFLVIKATQEIHDDVVVRENLHKQKKRRPVNINNVIVQIACMDVVFSLDSVLTAIGLTTVLWVMVIAITCSILVMLYASEPISRFIGKHPSIKMLALSFLMMIGMVLMADSFSFHIPRGYVYFAMGFSLLVESLNLLKRSRRKKRTK